MRRANIALLIWCEADFYKPGDFITYDVTVLNKGTIKGILEEVVITQEPDEELSAQLTEKSLTINDIYETTTTALIGSTLDSDGGTYNFDVKTKLKDIDFLPVGKMTTKIEVKYTQEDTIRSIQQQKQL